MSHSASRHVIQQTARRVWALLLKPSPAFITPPERLRAAFLAALSLLGIAGSLLALAVFRDAGVYGVLFGLNLAASVLIYALSRTRFYTASAVFAVVVASAWQFAACAVANCPCAAALAAIIPMLLASFFFTPWLTILLWAGFTLYLVAQPGAIDLEMALALFFLGATTFILLASIQTRRLVEAALNAELHARLATQERERMLAAAVERSPASIIMTDISGAITYVNPQFTRLTSYTSDEVMGKNPRILKSGYTTKAEYKRLWDTISSGGTWHGEFHNRKKNGELYWELASIAPLHNADGEITHYLAVKEDITARKRTEKALIESERRFRQMFEQNRAVKLLIDPTSGLIVNANRAAAEFYGWDVETLRTMHIQEINTLPDEEIFKAMKQALTGDCTIFQFQHWLASGEMRDVDIFVGNVEIDDKTLLYSIIVDATDKREAERARQRMVDELRESEGRYRALFEQSNDAVFILNLDGIHIAANQRAADMLGYTVAELPGLSFRDVSAEANNSSNVLQRLLAGEIVRPYEYRFRRKDGTTFLVEINVELVRADDGTPIHIQSIARDISERKEYEQREIMLALEQERSQLLADFLEGVSHEFRTPLSIIGSSTYLLKRTPTHEKVPDRVRAIEEQIKRLTRLIDAMLTLTRLQQPDQLEMMNADTMEIIDEVGAELRRRAEEADITVELNLPSELPAVCADMEYLPMALMQLIDNAIHHTPPGGKITLSAAAAGKWLVLTLSDGGQGIAPEDLPHVFKRFYRADKARTQPGFGLGLPIAKQVIEAHGGRIDIAHTAPETGTVIVVKLPFVC